MAPSTRRDPPGRERTGRASRAGRRTAPGLVPLLALVLLVSLALGQGWLHRVGVFTQPEPLEVGTAQVLQCRPSVLRAGLMQVCTADVTWSDGRAQPGASVWSADALSGAVAVSRHEQQRMVPVSSGSTRPGFWIIPDSQPRGGSGLWFVPVLGGSVLLAVALGALFPLITRHTTGNRRTQHGDTPGPTTQHPRTGGRP